MNAEKGFENTFNQSSLAIGHLEELIAFRNDFILGKVNDPSSCPYLHPEIAASWLRSRNYGVDPYVIGQTLSKRLNNETFQELLDTYATLIDVTSALIATFDGLMLVAGYSILLTDKDGVVLLHKNEWTTTPPFAAPDPVVGMVMDEKSVGTNAHSMCFNIKQPVQLLGPEHYCVQLKEDIIGFAVPITDDSNDLIAVLGLITMAKPQSLGDEHTNGLNAYIMDMLITISQAVEVRLRLEKKYATIISANNPMDGAQNNQGEGIVTVSNTGKIIHINQEGAKILNLDPHDIGDANIRDFLRVESPLMGFAGKGEKVDINETIYTEDDEKVYRISIRPTLGKDTRQLETVVLRFKTNRHSTVSANKKGSTTTYSFDDILGESREIKEAIARAQLFATSDENILLIGESGTGKEVFAQAIHNASCPQGPFMAVNCAAMPRELIESELFGYEGGSFTGADRSGRPGKIEMANGGTLFLDEIGDMPLELQAVLLRTLEDKQIMRIGGRRYKKVDFRLIAATNKDLNQMVKEKLFREDLYFRLSVLPVHIPPLRDRKNDIPLLIQYHMEIYCQKNGMKPMPISSVAAKKLNEYDWPGNLRELRNAMIYAMKTARTGTIEINNLPISILLNKKNEDEITSTGDDLTLKNLEKLTIERAMNRANNRVTLAADLLGISKATLYRKLIEYKIAVE
ncbi:sigma 54-interacting transcriptional regulator [Dehalobacter sp. DCM]|uniref:sigma-54 interaction domain-containing protein n=1 Tax=Dehalobacter sp. DCM TaxID=2907827 RepID=UPI003081A233|nr:sigma 54-interacting transcriptional regulator [Dehalobacter sp. DCM]